MNKRKNAVDRYGDINKINIEFSSSCNLRCKWCSLDHAKKPVFMPVEILEKIMDGLVERGFNNLDSIDLHNGGEALLHPEFSLLMQTIASRKHRLVKTPKIMLLTNATLLDHSKAEE